MNAVSNSIRFLASIPILFEFILLSILYGIVYGIMEYIGDRVIETVAEGTVCEYSDFSSRLVCFVCTEPGWVFLIITIISVVIGVIRLKMRGAG
jgi:hypothetical protein